MTAAMQALERSIVTTHPVLLVLAIAVLSMPLAEIPLGFRVPAMVLQMVLPQELRFG